MSIRTPGCRLARRLTLGALAALATAGCRGGGHSSSGALQAGKVTITSATSPGAAMGACAKVLPASVLAQAIGAPKGSYSRGSNHTQVENDILQCEYDQNPSYGEAQLYVEISPSQFADASPNGNDIVGKTADVTAQLQLAPAPGVNQASVRAALDKAASQVQFK